MLLLVGAVCQSLHCNAIVPPCVFEGAVVSVCTVHACVPFWGKEPVEGVLL